MHAHEDTLPMLPSVPVQTLRRKSNPRPRSLRFLALNYRASLVHLFDPGGHGVFSVEILDGEVRGLSLGVGRFSVATTTGSDRLIRIGASEIELRGSSASVSGPGGTVSLALHAGVLTLRKNELTCTVGLKNLRITASSPFEAIGPDGSAIFPYSVPLEIESRSPQEVVFPGPIVLAPEYWKTGLLCSLRSSAMPWLIASLWVSMSGLAASGPLLKRIEAGVTPGSAGFAVVSADCATLLGILGALHGVRSFLDA